MKLCSMLAARFRWLPTVAVAATLLAAAGCSRPASAPATEPPDYAAIRGTNYVPSYASTSVAIWKNFDAEVIDRELGYAERLRFNAVRFFLQYVVYEHDPDQFLANLDEFVALADKHGLKVMIVLFDSCFGEEPAMDKDQSPKWVNNPGFSRLGEEHRPALEKYVRDVVERYRGDPRILAWDVMNEPMADLEHVTRAERATIWQFVSHFCEFVKQADPTHPITVGHAVPEYIPQTMDQVDVLSIHSYLTYEEWLQGDIDLAVGYAKQAGKPVIFTEFGNSGAGQKYEAALDVIERNGLGFFLWELMIAKMQFNDQQGLVYPDGTIREPAAVARVLGFRVKGEDEEGAIPLIKPPDWTPVKTLLDQPEKWRAYLDEAEKAPRTPEGIRAHIYRVGMLGRFTARPTRDARDIFEQGLSIFQLFRMERNQEAVAAYEQMLELTRKAVEAKLGG